MHGPTNPTKCARCISQYILGPNPSIPLDEEALSEKIQAWRQYIQLLYNEVVDGVFFASGVFQGFFTQFLKIPEHKAFLVPHGIRPPRSRPAVSSEVVGKGSESSSRFEFRGSKFEENHESNCEACRAIAISPKSNIARASDIRNPASDYDKPVTFCFIGSTVIRKGIELLSHAFQNIEPDLTQLLIYGYHYDPASAQELVKLPCVKHRGAFDDIDEIMAEVDVGIVPSYFEGYSRVLREFLSRSIPVIATRFFGSEIVKDGINGYLIDIGDQEALRERVSALIADHALLSRLKQGAAATTVPTLEEEIRNIHSVYQLLRKSKWG